ncbi:MAG TPA: hypothetical protein VGQ83_10085 [Polyangia bacterium]|jgi:hypothetical protein
MRRAAVVSASLLVLVLSGCAPLFAASVVRSRAARDFDCAEQAVQVAELGGRAYLAEGCGRQASYACQTNDYGIACVREAPLPR